MVEVCVRAFPEVVGRDLDCVAEVDRVNVRSRVATDLGEPAHPAARVQHAFATELVERPPCLRCERVSAPRRAVRGIELYAGEPSPLEAERAGVRGPTHEPRDAPDDGEVVAARDAAVGAVCDGREHRAAVWTLEDRSAWPARPAIPNFRLTCQRSDAANGFLRARRDAKVIATRTSAASDRDGLRAAVEPANTDVHPRNRAAARPYEMLDAMLAPTAPN